MTEPARPNPARKTVLVLSQVFVPDPASVGQHMADVAVELARRGHAVRVYTSARGYEDTTARYAPREDLRGVDVRRLSLASFGKRSILTRIVGTAAFMLQALLRGLFTPNLGGIFFSTSPPLIGVVAAVVGWVRRVPIAYWAMDLNPDQLIALGKLKATALPARLLETVNRVILCQAALVVALDRFMAERLRARFPGAEEELAAKLLVMPPWPHEAHVEPVEHADNPFRARHGLDGGTRVVMYSGNHSTSNPLDTLLAAAARQFKDDRRIRFLFVGGGTAKPAVEAFVREHGLTNAVCLPYQPLAGLRYSLGAADVHVVSLGADMVGIVHPCKVYGAMAVGRPILYAGPRPSHVSDLLDEHAIGWQFEHGDVDAAVAALEAVLATPADQLRAMGDAAHDVLPTTAGQDLLCGRLCDAIEAALGLPHRELGSRGGTGLDQHAAVRTGAKGFAS